MLNRRVREVDAKQIGQNMYTYLLLEHRRHYAQSELQEDRPFSYRRAAFHTGIPVGTLAKYRTGERNPNIIDLRDIADWLSSSLESKVLIEDFFKGVPSGLSLMRGKS